ncbi:MAG: hypothetical protein ACJ741_15140 [Pyrinomonadaceae bacterium]
MKRLATALAFVVLFAAGAFAQCRTGAPSHVSFERGKASAEINGEMPIKGDACYMLRARAGQQMSVTLSSVHDFARFNVFPPGGDHTIAHETSEWSGMLPASGDYVIAIYPRTNNEAGSFTLYVSIKAAATPTPTDAKTPAPTPASDASAQPYTFDAGEGAFVFDGKPPKGFEELTAFELPGVLLRLGDDGTSIVSVSTDPHASVDVKGGRQFKSRRISITGDEITFETLAVRGVSYEFTGHFIKHQVDKGQLLDATLKGRLTKFVNGSKVAEAPLSLYEAVGG